MLNAIIFGASLAGVYALLYYFNHKTPLPKGCEHLKADCDGCNITSCEMHHSHNIIEGEK